MRALILTIGLTAAILRPTPPVQEARMPTEPEPTITVNAQPLTADQVRELQRAALLVSSNAHVDIWFARGPMIGTWTKPANAGPVHVIAQGATSRGSMLGLSFPAELLNAREPVHVGRAGSGFPTSFSAGPTGLVVFGGGGAAEGQSPQAIGGGGGGGGAPRTDSGWILIITELQK